MCELREDIIKLDSKGPKKINNRVQSIDGFDVGAKSPGKTKQTLSKVVKRALRGVLRL